MAPEQSKKRKLRPWTWLLGALIGFLILGGWQPIFNFTEWSYYMTCDASKGSQTEAFDAFALWLFGGLSGAGIGAMSVFLYDLKKVKSAISSPSGESTSDSSQQTQSDVDVG